MLFLDTGLAKSSHGRSLAPENPRVAPSQGWSHAVKVSRTQSRSVKPSQGRSNPVKVGQTQSRSVKPSQGQSNPVKVSQTQSRSVKPSQGRSNQSNQFKHRPAGGCRRAGCRKSRGRCCRSSLQKDAEKLLGRVGHRRNHLVNGAITGKVGKRRPTRSGQA